MSPLYILFGSKTGTRRKIGRVQGLVRYDRDVVKLELMGPKRRYTRKMSGTTCYPTDKTGIVVKLRIIRLS